MRTTKNDNVVVLAKRAADLRMKRAQRPAVPGPEAERAAAQGARLLRGEEVKRDTAKAAKFLATAALGGIAAAKHELALLHLKGDGVAYDPEQAIEMLTNASNEGHAASSIALIELYIFGKHCPRDVDKALELLHQLAPVDEPAAMYYLAYIYDSEPAHKNSFEAAYWYRRAAEFGHFKSQIRLATIYATGEGLPRNRATAEAFLEVALESSGAQDPRFLLWQSERLATQPETEFVAQALAKAAAALHFAPAERLLLRKGWRQ